MFATLGDLASVVTRWRTWKLMGDQDIGMRYRRSMIGPFWISISMGVMLLGMSFLFSGLFEADFKRYLIFLSGGFLIWNMLLAMVTEGCTIAVDAEGQLRSVSIPLPVLAARMVYRNFVIFLHNALVIGVELAIFGAWPGPAVVSAIPGIAIVLLVGFLAATVLSPICLRFRDVTQVVASIMQLLFFMTPILWMPDQGRVPEIFVHVNPFYHLIELVRAPLAGRAPEALNWIVSGGLVAVLFVMSLASLTVARRRIFLWL